MGRLSVSNQSCVWLLLLSKTISSAIKTNIKPNARKTDRLHLKGKEKSERQEKKQVTRTCTNVHERAKITRTCTNVHLMIMIMIMIMNMIMIVIMMFLTKQIY